MSMFVRLVILTRMNDVNHSMQRPHQVYAYEKTGGYTLSKSILATKNVQIIQ